ncbi:MAG: GtrA family protein [Candidatus Yanofskybacteria bacterium]|nr:GtrA family protein [Candidatus Yanofskybacteria bacterium]
MKFTKKDFYFSIATGLITGFSAWRIFEYLGVAKFGNYSFAWFLLIVPVLWILGVNLGYFLGRWLGFFNQFGKFAAVGFTNAAIYFGVLNILINFSGFNNGIRYSVFVAIAFVVGTVHGYFWNKFWVFSVSGKEFGKQNIGGELGKFFSVYIIAGLINTGIASGVVNLANPLFGLTNDQWANFGGVAGSAVALVVSFIGVRVAVFKK